MWSVTKKLGRIYVATADTKNDNNISVFLDANDPATGQSLVALGCKEVAPASGKYSLVDKNNTTYTFNKMFIITLKDVKTGDPILVSIANILDKVQPADAAQSTAADTQVKTDYTDLKTSTTFDPKVKELQTAILASGNLKAIEAIKGKDNGIYGFETAAAIGLLLGIPAPSLITAEINKKIQAIIFAGKKYADDFFGTVVDPDDPTKKIKIADVIRKQTAEDAAKAAANNSASVTTTTTKKP